MKINVILTQYLTSLFSESAPSLFSENDAYLFSGNTVFTKFNLKNTFSHLLADLRYYITYTQFSVNVYLSQREL